MVAPEPRLTRSGTHTSLACLRSSMLACHRLKVFSANKPGNLAPMAYSKLLTQGLPHTPGLVCALPLQSCVPRRFRSDGTLPAKSGSILEAILYRGSLPRGEADTIVSAGARQARRIVSSLADRGVLESDNPRAPLRLSFPAALAHRWMPGLFPEKVS